MPTKIILLFILLICVHYVISERQNVFSITNGEEHSNDIPVEFHVIKEDCSGYNYMDNYHFTCWNDDSLIHGLGFIVTMKITQEENLFPVLSISLMSENYGIIDTVDLYSAKQYEEENRELYVAYSQFGNELFKAVYFLVFEETEQTEHDCKERVPSKVELVEIETGRIGHCMYRTYQCLSV